MIGWNIYAYFAAAALTVLAAASATAFTHTRRSVPGVFLGAAALVLGIFIAGMWASLGRPPRRTMGETRLWYSFFLVLATLFTYARWRYRWIVPLGAAMAAVFLVINILKPEIHDHTLMPALQSPWFVPHVTVYMFSYALLGCSFIAAAAGLVAGKDYSDLAEGTVYAGTAFFTLGMLFGALWAYSAWGSFWNWDPKESWALVTWGGYLLYIHLRRTRISHIKVGYLILVASFLSLQMCWWGINYLPSARTSVHTYTTSK